MEEWNLLPRKYNKKNNPEGECPAINLWPEAQVELDYEAEQWSEVRANLWMAQIRHCWRPIIDWTCKSPGLNLIIVQSKYLKRAVNGRESLQWRNTGQRWERLHSFSVMLNTDRKLSELINWSLCCQGWQVLKFEGNYFIPDFKILYPSWRDHILHISDRIY